MIYHIAFLFWQLVEHLCFGAIALVLFLVVGGAISLFWSRVFPSLFESDPHYMI